MAAAHAGFLRTIYSRYTRHRVGFALAAREQMQTGEEIAQHIERITESAQRNSGQVVDAARAAQGLQQLSVDLQKRSGNSRLEINRIMFAITAARAK